MKTTADEKVEVDQQLLVRQVYVGNDKIFDWWNAEEAAQRECPLAWGNHFPMPNPENWTLESTEITEANDQCPPTQS